MITYYILSKEFDITPLALQKRLYYINGFYAAFHSKPLFQVTSEAWIHGPVYKAVYLKFKNYRHYVIDDVKKDVERLINDETKRLIDYILNTFGIYSPKVLEFMTHEESPWKEARGNCSDEEPCYNQLSNDSISIYFKNVLKNYEISDYKEIKKYSSQHFQKIEKIYLNLPN